MSEQNKNRFEELKDLQMFLFNKYKLISASTYIPIVENKNKDATKKFEKIMMPGVILSGTKRSELTKPLIREVVTVKRKITPVNGFTIFTDNVILLDFDLYKMDDKGKTFFNTKFKNLINHTLSVKTPNDGIHLYFDLNEQQQTQLKKIKSVIDAYGVIGFDIKHINGVGFFFKMEGEYSIINKPDKLSQLPDEICEFIVKSTDKSVVKNNIKKKYDNSTEKKENSNVVTDESYYCEYTDEITQLLKFLKPEKYKTYNNFIVILFACHYEFYNYELFDQWAKTCPNYNAENNLTLWKSTHRTHSTPYTISTLYFHAKNDNPIEFNKYFEKERNKPTNIMYAENKVTDVLMAKYFYENYPNRFVFDKKTEELFYHDDFNVWNKIYQSKMYEFIENLEPMIVRDYNKRKHKLEMKIIKVSNMIDNDKEIPDDKLKILQKCISLSKDNLNNIKKIFSEICKYISMKKKMDVIAGMISRYYEIPQLSEKFDNINLDLFCFNNIAYDLKNKCFRLPKPDEFVSITTGYDYIDDINIEAEYEYLLKIISNMFELPEERDYILKYLSTALSGVINNETFMIWIGNASNGKGVLGRMMSGTLGSYYDTLDPNYFQENKNNQTGKADPEMANKIRTRFILSSEPDSNIPLRGAVFKKLTGGDQIQCRNLFKGCFSFIPHFKIVLQTNTEPIIDALDTGVIRRMLYIRFPYVFTDNPTQPFQKQIDKTIKERLPQIKYKIAFFHLLLHYYYLPNVEIPPSFLQHNNQYVANCNPVNEFITNCCERVNGAKTERKRFYEIFLAYNTDNRGIKIKKFLSDLRSLNINVDKKSDSIRFVENIIVKPEFIPENLKEVTAESIA